MTGRVLITGDNGFIGRHFAQRLVADGWDVVGVDRSAKSTKLSQHYTHYWEDIRAWLDRYELAQFDLVVHCAAVVGGRAKIEGQPLAIADNLSIDTALFQWALRAAPGRIVYFSSSAAYPVDQQTEDQYRRHSRAGSLDKMRLRESDIHWCPDEPMGLPDEVYGWAKLTGELLARRAQRMGLVVNVFRPFSGYGADQDGTYPFRAFLDRVLAKEDPFVIWGDGRQTRDFIHVDDIVAAVLAAIGTSRAEPLNLCSGEPTSFNQLARIMIEQLRETAPANRDYAPEFKHLLDRPVGVFYRVGSPVEMRGIYTPQVDLRTGVARAIRELQP